MRHASGSRASRAFGAALVLALALAACPSTSGGPDGGPIPTATPRGGEVVVAYPYEPATLNPFLAAGAAPATRDLVRPLMPALWRLGPKGARSPWLLASEPQAGGTPFTVRMRLRDDAVWSDGRPITAEDVRFTWQAVVRSPGIASRDGYDRISDIVVESPKALRLVFKEPFARWRDLFAAGLGVLPSHAFGGTDVSKALAGSWPVSGGPFVLTSWTRGLEMVLDRNPRAWGGPPLLDRIRIQFVPDVVTALQLYAHGKVDVLGPYAGVDFARRAGAIAGSQVTRDDGATWAGLFLNTRTPAISDVRVRRALAMVLDRAAIVEGIVREQGAGLDSPDAGDPARTAPSFSRYVVDDAAAGALLDAAGWTRGNGRIRKKGGTELSVTMAWSGEDELVSRVVRALNAQAAGAGIELNLVTLDANQLWASWLPGSRFQAAVIVVRDPPGGALRARFGLPGPENLSRLDDADLKAALEAADRTLDNADPVVDTPSGRVAGLVPVIPLFTLRVTLAARAGVHEVAASAAADGLFWNAERWWREGATPGPSPSS